MNIFEITDSYRDVIKHNLEMGVLEFSTGQFSRSYINFRDLNTLIVSEGEIGIPPQDPWISLSTLPSQEKLAAAHPVTSLRLMEMISDSLDGRVGYEGERALAHIQFFIGQAYMMGEHGLGADTNLGYMWLKKAAENQNLPAKFVLGEGHR